MRITVSTDSGEIIECIDDLEIGDLSQPGDRSEFLATIRQAVQAATDLDSLEIR